MALPLLFMAATGLVRAATPAIARYLVNKGISKATAAQARGKITATVTKINQAKNLKPTKPSLSGTPKVAGKKPAASTVSSAPKPKTTGSAPKPKSGGTTQLISKPKGNVISGKAREVKPGTSVATTGGRAVRGPGTSLQRIIRVKDKPSGKTMKNATRNDKRVTGSTAKPKKKSNLVRNLVIAGGALTGGVLATLDGDKKSSANTNKPTAKKVTPPSSKESNKSKKIDLGTVKARKVTPQKDAAPKNKVETKKAAPSKVISAGGNTGFGDKGNIFPGSAAERSALMKKWGGTGSAAAKAARAGKQGDIKGGDAALKAARNKRLSKSKKD